MAQVQMRYGTDAVWQRCVMAQMRDGPGEDWPRYGSAKVLSSRLYMDVCPMCCLYEDTLNGMAQMRDGQDAGWPMCGMAQMRDGPGLYEDTLNGVAQVRDGPGVDFPRWYILDFI